MTIEVTALTEADIPAYAEILEQSLNFEAKHVPLYVERMGMENFVLARRGGRVIGGCGAYRIGHFIGGRSVAASAVAAVAVASDQRGRGVASAMMTQLLRDSKQAGLPISSLFTAATALYRKSGYECAAESITYRVALRGLPRFDEPLQARPMLDADMDAIRALYSRMASRGSMLVDRSDTFWARVRAPLGKPAHQFVVEDTNGIAGWVTFTQKAAEGLIELRDFWACSQSGLRRLWRLLADNSSIFKHAQWAGPGADPRILVLEEADHLVGLKTQPMVRIVDVQAALTARGYSENVRGNVQFDIEDDLFADNAGRWTLSVEDGEAAVSPGGSGDLRISIRGLAALYTGHLTPWQLADLGLIAGPDDALTSAQGLFAGPAPWVSDMY